MAGRWQQRRARRQRFPKAGGSERITGVVGGTEPIGGVPKTAQGNRRGGGKKGTVNRVLLRHRMWDRGTGKVVITKGFARSRLNGEEPRGRAGFRGAGLFHNGKTVKPCGCVFCGEPWRAPRGPTRLQTRALPEEKTTRGRQRQAVRPTGH